APRHSLPLHRSSYHGLTPPPSAGGARVLPHRACAILVPYMPWSRLRRPLQEAFHVTVQSPSAPGSWSPPRCLCLVPALLLLLGLSCALVYAAPELTMGDVQRIVYFLVASAWNALFAFFVVAASSIGYLISRSPRWDHIAHASAEVGALVTA